MISHDREYLRTLRHDQPDTPTHTGIEVIAECEAYHEHMTRLRPADEWHEDMGDVLWFHIPLQEPPYVGSPLDTTWGDVWPFGETAETWYTHFQLITVKED